MTYRTVFWNPQTGQQEERDCTPEETAEIDARKAAAIVEAQNTTKKEMDEYKEYARGERDKMLNRIMGIGVSALIDNDNALKTAIKNTRTSLLDITNDVGVKNAKTKDEMKTAVLSAHAAIVAAAHPALKKALTGTD